METHGQVGPQNLGDGAKNVVRTTKDGSLAVAPALARYEELTRRGRVFIGANGAAQAVSVALATTYTGLALSNPAGSDKDLVLLAGNYALSVAPAAIASRHLIGGFSSAGVVTHTAAIVPTSAKLGSSIAPVAKVDSQATVVNPQYLLALHGGFTAAALPSGGNPQLIDFGGLIVIPPGGWVAWGSLTAVTGFGCFVWAEVDR